MTFLYIFAGSAVAVTLLVALAAWAGTPYRGPDFTETEARRLFAEEFPTETISALWLAADGAVGRAGDRALVLFRVGDGYASRSAPWSAAVAARPEKGRVAIPTGDFAAPLARLSLAAWPPVDAALGEAAT